MVAKEQYTQKGRRLSIATPLGEDALLLRSFQGQDAMSALFRFDLDLLSENDSIAFGDIVGKKATVTVLLADGSERYWNGYVSRFSQGARDQNLTLYHAELVPWLWFLTRTADCRIFQNLKVPDIIKHIFGDLGFTDFEFQLYGDFVTRDYCVQYRETDFNFISRLMEEEGIFYFFRHDAGKHTLVLSNDAAVHEPCPNQPKARYELTAGGWQDDDVILEWRMEQEVRPGKYALTDYNFETPATSLAVAVAGHSSFEIYDYPGEYRKRDQGTGLVRIRLQEEETPRLLAGGRSTCRAFVPGFRFDLTEHYRADANQSYVLTSVYHRASQGGDYRTGSAGAAERDLTYENTFECIPRSTPFRPPRVTRRPFVQGCQTAVVVGPAGEEIYTDKYGRVKVQFHWDREGKRNENSSCWVRVSQPWAGKGWGYVAIPRIGQEVVVDFLEGNPDEPLITGRVYNAGQMPPFGLPGGAVVSGVKSNSTKGGGGYNEISLNDTKGNELIQVHAQFDMDSKIEHDDRLTIGHDETIKVGNNRTESVGVNESITIGNNRTEKVGANENITIGANRTESVASNETISIGANRTETVAASESITVALTRTRNVGINEMVNIGAAQEITIGAAQTLTVGAVRSKTVGASESASIGASQSVEVGASQSITVGANRTVSVGADLSESVGSNEKLDVGSNRSASVGGDDSLEVGKKLSITAGDEIVLVAGDASIVLKKDGSVGIKGKDIAVTASGKITIKASSDMVLKGSKISEN